MVVERAEEYKAREEPSREKMAVSPFYHFTNACGLLKSNECFCVCVCELCTVQRDFLTPRQRRIGFCYNANFPNENLPSSRRKQCRKSEETEDSMEETLRNWIAISGEKLPGSISDRMFWSKLNKIRRRTNQKSRRRTTNPTSLILLPRPLRCWRAFRNATLTPEC